MIYNPKRTQANNGMLAPVTRSNAYSMLLLCMEEEA